MLTKKQRSENALTAWIRIDLTADIIGSVHQALNGISLICDICITVNCVL